MKTFTDLTHETKQRVRVMTLLTYYKVHYLRVYSWQQADRVMSTETGINILKTVDNTTDLAEIMLDKYLPPPPLEESYPDPGKIFSSCTAICGNLQIFLSNIWHIKHLKNTKEECEVSFFEKKSSSLNSTWKDCKYFGSTSGQEVKLWATINL